MTVFRTLTGDLESILGTIPYKAMAFIEYNVVAPDALVDLDNDKVYPPAPDRIPLNADGTFSIQVIDSGAVGTNVPAGTLRCTVTVHYTAAPGAAGNKLTWACRNFAVTADMDLSDAVATADPPATILGQMADLLAQAEELVGVDTTDAAFAYNLNNGALTQAALDDQTAALVAGPSDTHDALTAGFATRPELDELMLDGTLTPVGAWDSGTTYDVRDVVTDAGVTYVAKTAVAGGEAAPAANANWMTLGTSVDAQARADLADAHRVPEDIGDIPGWDAITTTADGWLIAGQRSDGEPYSYRTEALGGVPATAAPEVDIPGWDHVDLDPTGTYVLGGVLTGARPYFDRLAVRDLQLAGSSLARPAAFITVGDSMFADTGEGPGTVNDAVADALGLPVFQGGHSGYTSTETAFCAGAVEVWAEVAGGVIPATGSVGLTLIEPTRQWRTGTARDFGVDGYTEDGLIVRGTLSKSTSEVWTFAASDLGEDVPAPRYVVFHGIDQDPILQGYGTFAWMGRNTFTVIEELADPLDLAREITVRDYVWLRDHVYRNAIRPRFLGVPVHNRSDMGIGTDEYAAIIETRDALADALGPDFYDLRRWLIHQGLDAVGITPTSQDLADIANDVVPESLRQTGGAGLNHYTPDAREAIGNHLAFVATTRGWIKP